MPLSPELPRSGVPPAETESRIVHISSGAGQKLIGFIAYGLYHEAQREWISDFRTREGRYPNEFKVRAQATYQAPSRAIARELATGAPPGPALIRSLTRRSARRYPPSGPARRCLTGGDAARDAGSRRARGRGQAYPGHVDSYDSAACVRNIACHTLFICSEDPLFSVEEHEFIVRSIRNGRFAVVEAAGHAVQPTLCRDCPALIEAAGPPASDADPLVRQFARLAKMMRCGENDTVRLTGS
jgi:pimeloyl-ACP methyl ester carboxylesterase